MLDLDSVQRFIRAIGNGIEQAIVDHEQRCHPGQPSSAEEPPLRAISTVTHFVHEVAEESAADERRAHEAAFHSGVPAKREDAPAIAAAEALAEIGNSRMFVHEAVDRYSSEAVRLHQANYHGITPLANDGYALLEQVRMDANLRAQLRQVLTDSQTVGHG